MAAITNIFCENLLTVLLYTSIILLVPILFSMWLKCLKHVKFAILFNGYCYITRSSHEWQSDSDISTIGRVPRPYLHSAETLPVSKFKFHRYHRLCVPLPKIGSLLCTTVQVAIYSIPIFTYKVMNKYKNCRNDKHAEEEEEYPGKKLNSGGTLKQWFGD